LLLFQVPTSENGAAFAAHEAARSAAQIRIPGKKRENLAIYSPCGIRANYYGTSWRDASESLPETRRKRTHIT
jgi:hypothetical protein